MEWSQLLQTVAIFHFDGVPGTVSIIYGSFQPLKPSENHFCSLAVSYDWSIPQVPASEARGFL